MQQAYGKIVCKPKEFMITNTIIIKHKTVCNITQHKVSAYKFKFITKFKQ